jgi:hypothetical protein
MTSDNIFKACRAKGMKPVCDHSNYFDGMCEIVGGGWHFSHPHHTKNHAWQVNPMSWVGAYFYCGRAHHHWALRHGRDTHRWSNGNHRDGETICTKPLESAKKFEWRDWEFHRATVQGTVNSQSILKACCAKGMRPVCDHWNYGDGQCRPAGGHWHFSHPHHDAQQGVPLDKVRGVFFYAGRANGNRALINTGSTHKWSRGYEKDGDTLCVTRSEEYKKAHKGDYGILKPGMVVALKGGHRHRYCADETQHHRTVCNRNRIGQWEKFTVVAAKDQCGNDDSGMISLRGGQRNQLCADEDHRWNCNRNGIGQWERFQQMQVGWKQVALIGGKNGKFCADEVNRIRCNRNGIGQWERFRVQCVSNCNGEEESAEEESAETRRSDLLQDTTSLLQQETAEATSNNDTAPLSFDKAAAPNAWHRYGASFKWLWPPCPNGDCRKAKGHKIMKESKECKAEFIYGIQSCGKYPTREVTWENPVSKKVETSEIGCSCRGQLIKSSFYGSVISTKDMSNATQKLCATQFNKWGVEIRNKLDKWAKPLEKVSQEIAMKCSPTYPVVVKEQKFKTQVKKLELKHEDTQTALRATPPMIQDGFKWLQKPEVHTMPKNYRYGEFVNNGDCEARFTSGMSVCDHGHKESIDSVSFGCGCNGMYFQTANFGVVTRMKDQTLKTQKKCAHLFAHWSAGLSKHHDRDERRAHTLAPQIALKCNPTRRLAIKVKKQDAHLKTVGQLTPQRDEALDKLTKLKDSHEKLHKKQLKEKAREISDKAIEKKLKSQGQEKQAKALERKDKELASKKYHGSWADKNDAEERMNKAQKVADHNEKMMVKDLHARAQGMERQIKSADNKEFDSGVENTRLKSQTKKARREVDQLKNQVKTDAATQQEAKVALDTMEVPITRLVA